MAWSGCICSAIGMLCITFLFQAVGFSIPLWMVVKVPQQTTDDITVHVGIWYVMSCIAKQADSCKSRAIDIDFSAANLQDSTFTGDTQDLVSELSSKILGSIPAWWGLAIASTVAVGLTALATLIVICCRCAGIHSKGWFVLSLVFLLFGSLVGLAVVVLYSIAYAVLFSFVSQSIDASNFPWSLLIFGIGSLMGLITTIVLIVVACKWQRYGEYQESDEESERDMQMDTMGKSGYDNPKFNDNYLNDRSGKDYSYPSDRSYSNSNKAYSSSGRDYVRSAGGRDYDRGSRRDDYGRRDDYHNHSRGYDQQYRGYTPSGNDYMYRPYAQRY